MSKKQMISSQEYFMNIFNEEDKKYLPSLKTIPQLLNYVRKTFSNDVAVVEGDNSITYETLYNDVLKVYGGLQNLGIKQGDRIGVFYPNCYDSAITLLGVMAYGATAVIFPAQLGDEMVLGVSYKYALTAVISDNELAPKTELAKSRLVHIKYLSTDEFSKVKAPVNGLEDIPDSLPACIIFSSGTTGSPKGAVLTQLNVLTGTYLGTMGVSDFTRQTYYTVLPLSHVFGLIRSFLTAIYSGSTIHFAKSIQTIFKDMASVKPTILILVPALCEIMLNVIKKYGFGVVGGRLKVIIAGAATVPPYFIPAYAEYGVRLFPGYGLTESTNLVSGNPDIEGRSSSVGRVYPGLDTKVVNGELWIKGPNVFSGYFNDPEENARSFEDGYFKTGDLVDFDDEGFLYITGRSKDVIVLPNGENVSPNHVESHFLQENLIQDCLVYENEENRLTLEVFPRAAEYFALPEEIREEKLRKNIAILNTGLLPHERVNVVIIRTEDFPRTPSMKVIRPKKVMHHDPK